MKNEQMRQNNQWGQAGTSPLHVSGRDHVMGRSQFIDDIPKPGNLLYVKVMVSRLQTDGL